MYKLLSHFGLFIIVLLLGLSLSGCGSKTYLNVDYHLPDEPQSLAGKKIFLQVTDARSDQEIFSEKAKSKFEHFTGLFSLAVVTAEDQRQVIGAYDLVGLFREALSKRLSALGVAVLESQEEGQGVMTVTLNRFTIDLAGSKWMASVDYATSLTRDEKTTAREKVSGSAERTKIMGKKDAEKVVGEIFTEMVNKLNLERLFERAKV